MTSPSITLNHGAGGEAMHRLIRQVFVRHFGNPILNSLADAALLRIKDQHIAFTTDSYTVKPIEFPGGDIGRLSVCGTVNDLAVMGAEPLFFAVGFIIEEGLDSRLLERIVISAADAARAAGVQIVTGDTKVVPRGECDRIFINTAGIGSLPLGKGLSRRSIAAGDRIILSGTAGDHGLAVLAARAELGLQTSIQSDCAPLNGLIGAVLRESDAVKWMRDPTRGGVAAVLTELADSQPLELLIHEKDLPLCDGVRAACEMLGFDPLHLANEGKVVMVVEAGGETEVLSLLREHPLGCQAAVIGKVTAEGKGKVWVQTASGGVRRMLRPTGELLPRIC